jgi:hypothetical protein
MPRQHTCPVPVWVLVAGDARQAEVGYVEVVVSRWALSVAKLAVLLSNGITITLTHQLTAEATVGAPTCYYGKQYK